MSTAVIMPPMRRRRTGVGYQPYPATTVGDDSRPISLANSSSPGVPLTRTGTAAAGHADVELQQRADLPPARRLRNSCEQCRRRRGRCSRTFPCSACVTSGDGMECNWEGGRPAGTNFYSLTKSQYERDELGQIVERIRRLHTVVGELQQAQAQQDRQATAVAMSASSTPRPYNVERNPMPSTSSAALGWDWGLESNFDPLSSNGRSTWSPLTGYLYSDAPFNPIAERYLPGPTSTTSRQAAFLSPTSSGRPPPPPTSSLSSSSAVRDAATTSRVFTSQSGPPPPLGYAESQRRPLHQTTSALDTNLTRTPSSWTGSSEVVYPMRQPSSTRFSDNQGNNRPAGYR